METFSSGKHLNEMDFDQNFEHMTNQQIELIHQLKQKQGRDNVWNNEDGQMHELDNVINNATTQHVHLTKTNSTLKLLSNLAQNLIHVL